MLARGEYTMAGLERELGITPGLIRQWKRKAERNGEYVAPNSEPATPAAYLMDRAKHRHPRSHRTWQ